MRLPQWRRGRLPASVESVVRLAASKYNHCADRKRNFLTMHVGHKPTGGRWNHAEMSKIAANPAQCVLSVAFGEHKLNFHHVEPLQSGPDFWSDRAGRVAYFL